MSEPIIIIPEGPVVESGLSESDVRDIVEETVPDIVEETAPDRDEETRDETPTAYILEKLDALTERLHALENRIENTNEKITDMSTPPIKPSIVEETEPEPEPILVEETEPKPEPERIPDETPTKTHWWKRSFREWTGGDR